MNQWIDELRKKGVGEILTEEALAPHTTWKIGGPADVLVQPREPGRPGAPPRGST